jgi:hypothetical protein
VQFNDFLVSATNLFYEWCKLLLDGFLADWGKLIHKSTVNECELALIYLKSFLFSPSEINHMNNKFLTITAIIFGAALLRLIPHAPNFSPIGAIALYGGAYLNRKYLAYIIPIAAMIFSDLFLGFYGPEMLITYAGFVASIFIGTQLKKNITWMNVALGSVAASLVFFLITNFVFFYPTSLGPIYTHNFAGIINSYVAGWPFFQNTFASDLLYNSILFGGFYLLNINIPSLSKEKVKVL